jgi:hypothetical protein
MPVHKVDIGDCMSSIAEQYGFFWQSLWELPENAALKNKRKDPNVLLPGEDEVFIPEKRPKEVSKPTNEVHKFRCKSTPAKLRIQFKDEDDQPRANVPYVLKIDGNIVSKPGSKTTSNGMVECSISPLAQQGVLTLGEGEEKVEYTLRLGYLNPVTELTGVKQRLRNLGFFGGAISRETDDKTKDAIRAFQSANKLEPTGETDQATLKKLHDLHDGA